MLPRRIVFSLCMLGGVAGAVSADGFDDYARVRSAVPEFERVNRPRQECYNEIVESRVRPVRPAPPPRERDVGGTVLGGIVGGVIGNQFGKGHGREAATAAGAVAGALLGGQVDGRSEPQYAPPPDEYVEREVRRCRSVEHWEQRLIGYRVSYEYAGRRYTTILPYDPGREIRVRVSVEPMR